MKVSFSKCLSEKTDRTYYTCELYNPATNESLRLFVSEEQIALFLHIWQCDLHDMPVGDLEVK